jgi:hypothetical protein
MIGQSVGVTENKKKQKEKLGRGRGNERGQSGEERGGEETWIE